jgi:dolichol-phosphate mannosyltransferase
MAGLSLILPTLDERENIEQLVPRLLAEVEEIEEILVVDDSSTDGTPEAVERLSALDPRVRLVRRVGEPCLCASLQQGLDLAQGSLVGWMDADEAMGAADLKRLIAAVRNGAEVAIASRFVPGGQIKGQTQEGLAGRLHAFGNLRSGRDPWLGVALSWALNVALLPLVVRGGVHDYTSGIIVAERRALEGVRLRGQHGEYFVELWAELVARGLRIVEVGYRVQERRWGRSKTGEDLVDYARRGVGYLAAGLRARRIWPR